jgi:hypothetical protein
MPDNEQNSDLLELKERKRRRTTVPSRLARCFQAYTPIWRYYFQRVPPVVVRR